MTRDKRLENSLREALCVLDVIKRHWPEVFEQMGQVSQDLHQRARDTYDAERTVK